ISDHTRWILRADTHGGEPTDGLPDEQNFIVACPGLGAEPLQSGTDRCAGSFGRVRKVGIAVTCAIAPRMPWCFAVNAPGFAVPGTNRRDHGEAPAQPKMRVAGEHRRRERLALFAVAAPVGKYHDRKRAIT